MSPPRTIGVVTGARADYGHLRWLMTAIVTDVDLRLQVIVTGMHLSPEFGLTFREIEADGFSIDAKVETLLSSDTPVGIAKSIGLGTIGLAESLDRLRPDILVLLGDRFEILAAAQAAVVARIPIAHIHGGETTEGAFDEGIRHAVTKFAHWHFVAAEPYRKRVIQLGEAPERVFNHGAPGLDHLNHLAAADRSELEGFLGVQLEAPLLLVTYHPATLGRMPPQEAMDELLAALDMFPRATVVFTYPNADTGGRSLIAQIDVWTGANARRARAFASLGQQRYLGLMREADVVLGNSSSGLIEAPALKRASVNIGDRQTGRLRASSVIDAGELRHDIAAAISRALSSEFRAGLKSVASPYGFGGASMRITATLKSVDLAARKSFFGIEHGF